MNSPFPEGIRAISVPFPSNLGQLAETMTTHICTIRLIMAETMTKAQNGKSTEIVKTPVKPSTTVSPTRTPDNSKDSIGEDSTKDQNEGSTSIEEDEDSLADHDSEKAESADGGYKKSSSPPRESDEIFRSIRQAIRASSIEQEFKAVALSDLREAQNVYRNEGYKACVVMLGAVVEGLMLAVLRKPEVLDELRNNTKYTGKVKVAGGLGHSDYADNAKLADAIADNLAFDAYRQLIIALIPEIESQRVEDIQHFRNAIHPSIPSPEIK